jgi:hypothetical protein
MKDEISNLDEDHIRDLILDCIYSNNSEIMVKIIIQLKKDYEELAKLATMGYYDGKQTHKEVMDYITFET